MIIVWYEQSFGPEIKVVIKSKVFYNFDAQDILDRIRRNDGIRKYALETLDDPRFKYKK